MSPRYLRGTVAYPMTERMADTIRVHGLAWAVRYYTKRLPLPDARLLLRIAYCSTGV